MCRLLSSARANINQRLKIIQWRIGQCLSVQCMAGVFGPFLPCFFCFQNKNDCTECSPTTSMQQGWAGGEGLGQRATLCSAFYQSPHRKKKSRLSYLPTKQCPGSINHHRGLLPGEAFIHLHPSCTEYIFDVIALAASTHLSSSLAFAHSKKLPFKTFKVLKC